MNDNLSINLEKHETKNTVDQHVNGSLTVIWRDWDNIIKHEPKMVYVSSVNPGEIKGPHTHTKRNGYFVCIHGKVLFICLLYTSPSPRDVEESRMPSSA